MTATNATKHYEIAYIVSPDGYLVGEIEDFSFDDSWKLRELRPHLSDGDLLRCFSKPGIVDTYFLKIEESSDWPPIVQIARQSNNLLQGEREMRYMELDNKYEIKVVIEELKDRFRDLSKILIPSERETTAKENNVVTLYYNLEPSMKVEGEEEVINQFIERLEEEKKGY